MAKAIVVKFAQPTTRKPAHLKATSDMCASETEWNSNLTDYANYRKAAQELVAEVNTDFHNVTNGIRYVLTADAMLPDGKAHVFIMSE